MIRPPIMRENPKAASAPQKNIDKDNYMEMKTPVSEIGFSVSITDFFVVHVR